MNVINKFKLYKYKIKLDNYRVVKTTAKVMVPVALISATIPLIENIDMDKQKNQMFNNSSYNSEYKDYDNYTNHYYVPQNENTTVYNNSTEKADSPVTNNIPNSNLTLNLDEYSKTIINSNISLSTTALNNYIASVNNIEVEYKYADIYNMKNEFSKYQTIDKYTSNTSNLFKNGTISANTILDIVKKNNSNAELSASAKVSDSELLEVCNIMADLLNDEIKNNKIDKNLLSEKINDLKIVAIDEYANGFFDSETCRMGFNFSLIKSKGIQFYKMVVEHEVYHLIQSNSLNEIKDTNLQNRFGFTYKYNNADLNVFAWNWFYEGSAAYLACDRNNTKEPTNYESILKDIDTIKVSTILMPQNGVTDFENLSLSNDINDLFNYFGCETYQDKIEVLNMMYSMNIKTNIFSTYDEFNDKYEKINGQTISITNLRKELNDDIAQTLTKCFYKSLASALLNKNVKVEEVFAIISVFENELSRNIWYNSNQSTLTEFYDTYDKIQTDFFQLIANSLELKVEDVQEAYNAYNNEVVVKLDNVTLLNNEQKEFYNYILSTRKGDKMNSINYVFEKYESMQR